jgi:hypothetical protein
MADQDFELDVLRDLLEEADAIGQLAKGEKSFVAAYEAFRAEDRKAFQTVLKRLKLVPKCHLVCEWIRIKECLLLCLKLCGPPKPVEKPPNPRVLAEAIVRITSDEKLVRQLVQILQKRDRAAFQRFVKAQKLEAICHLFCHWVCYVRYRLVCRWVCDLELKERPDLVAELTGAGAALRALLEKRQVFNEAVSASQAGDAGKLRSVIEGAGLIPFCHFICFFFCSWRCVLVCLTLCRKFPLEPIRDEIREAFAFAKAMQQLRRRPAELERLSVAVGAGDAKTYAAIVGELKLGRFCIQLCHWLCFLRCRRFCILVCPDPFNHPWFTHVGDFGIYSDIDAGTGLTNKSQAGHGGPNYGFFECLKLRGFCPKYDPANPGAQMAYRFLFRPAGVPTPTPITGGPGGGFVCEVLVGSRYTFWNGNPFALQSVRIRGTGTTSPTPPPPGPGLTPPDHYIVPDPQGWITVDAKALDDGFNGWLMGFASPVAFPGGNPAPGVPAGTAVPVGNQKNGTDCAIIFQATRVSTIAAVNGGAAPDYTNQLAKIHISNWNEVSLINLEEFSGGLSCSPVTNDLHIQYTTDHELMAAWFIDMVTAATVSPAPTFPGGTGPRGAAGTDFHDTSTWPSCSYLLRLHTRRSLTDGLLDDTDKWEGSFLTFCIEH